MAVRFPTIEALMQESMWDDAIVECRAVLQVQPVQPMLWGYLGCCHYRKEEWAHAVEALQRATALDPQFFDAGLKLAQSLYRLGRHIDVCDVADDFLKIRPNDNMLRGLRIACEPHLAKRRQDGWERSIRVDAKIVTNYSVE